MLCYLGPLLLGLLTGIESRANRLIVRTNANAGTGSLREAIQLAGSNGSSERDSILFNLSGSDLLAYTIQLSAELPPLSTNLFIDGGKTSGVFIPLVNAGIVLSFSGPVPASGFHFFRILDASDITITGLAFQNLAGFFPDQQPVAGIQLKNVQRIRIGRVGSGNLFSGPLLALVNKTTATDPAGTLQQVHIEGNLFGLSAQLEKTDNNRILLEKTEELVLKENLFVNTTITISREASSRSNFLEFSNNRSNNVNGQPIVDGSFLLQLEGTKNDEGKTLITYNFLQGTDRMLELSNLAHAVEIRGNTLQSSAALPCSPLGFAIRVTNCGQVVIGTPEGEGTNQIYGAIWQVGTGKTSIWQNQFLGDIHLPAGTIPASNRITYYFENILRGKASPGSIIQLYGTNCTDPCPLRTYINSAIADGEGNWMISHNFLAGAYFLTITKNGQSGEFQPLITDTATTILLNDIKISQDTCNSNSGKLELVNPAINPDAITMLWKNADGKIVGNGQSATGLSAGFYYLETAKTDMGCRAQTGPFEVQAVSIRFPPLPTKEIWTEPNSTLELLAEPVPGSWYYLFDKINAGTAIDSSETGRFIISIGTNNRTLYLQTRKESCRSNFQEFTINIRKAADLYFPTAFSPDNNGKNERWRPVTTASFEQYRLRIFNRLGQELFFTDNPAIGWDGHFRGIKQAIGVYTYTLEALDRARVQIRKHGQFLLLR